MADQPNYLPLNDDPISPEEAAAGLETFDVRDPDELVVDQPPPPPVGRSWGLDFIEGKFFIRPGHGPIETQGDDTLAFWIEKTLRTARGAHPIYPNEYGMVSPFNMIGHTLTSADYADLESRIFDALTFHDRITDVVDFAAEQDPADDALVLDFRVVKDDGTELTITNLLLS